MSPIKSQKKLQLTEDDLKFSRSRLNDAISGTQNFQGFVDPTLWAKFRRLRIEENNLLKEAYKTGDYPYRKIKNDQYNILSSIKLYNSDGYFEVRDLYKNLKESIKGTPGDIDLEKIKDLVYKIDEKLSCLQNRLPKEIADLKTEEITLSTDIDADAAMLRDITMPLKKEVSSYVIKPNPKKTYRNTSNIPEEVQLFQRFVRSTGGHTGKWGNFEHLLFVKTYGKHASLSTSKIPDDKIIFKLFSELMLRIPDLTMEAVAVHYEWFLKYSRLKKDQQNAILKWKENKKPINKTEGNADDKSFDSKPKHRSDNKDMCVKNICATSKIDEKQETSLESRDAEQNIQTAVNTNNDDSVLKTVFFNYQPQRLCRTNVENRKQLKENIPKRWERASVKSTFDKPTEQSKNKITAPYTKNDSFRLKNFTIADLKIGRSIPNWRKCLVGNYTKD